MWLFLLPNIVSFIICCGSPGRAFFFSMCEAEMFFFPVKFNLSDIDLSAHVVACVATPRIFFAVSNFIVIVSVVHCNFMGN